MTTYEYLEFRSYRNVDDERQLLANFVARIDVEIRYIDGGVTDTYLTLSAEAPNPDDSESPLRFPPVTISAASFAAMGWVMGAWGVRAVIQPGTSVKEDLRTAIQLDSRPKIEIVYRHMGWADGTKPRKYLHAGGAITAKGNDSSVSVQLPHELRNYKLALPADKKTLQAAVRATLALIDVAPTTVTWPMLAATLAPLYGPVDYACHLTGRTGTFKSELTSLFQSHYGSEMDARHLPGSWSSTANALEAQAYYAKNAMFTVDDFVPSGTAWQVRSYQVTADKIMRAQGNQSGRARLTDTSNLQTAMYPRGLCMSTGEDTPEGHSVRARMMILELSPGDVATAKLTVAQRNRPLYVQTIAAFVQHLCTAEVELADVKQQIRDQNLGVGHTRTPAMLGSMVACTLYFLEWAASVGAIKAAEKTKLANEATMALTATAEAQKSFLETTDPCDLFCSAFRQTLSAGHGHIRTQSGGIPNKATQLGWISQGDPQSDIPMYKSQGPCIGWINWDDQEIYLNGEHGYNVVRKTAGSEVSLTKGTMLKRLKDAGILSRTDETRQRNTCRVTCERHPHQVLVLSIPLVLDDQEQPNETEEVGDAYEGGVPDQF